MNKKFLPLLDKIGDISRQLSVLYNKLDDGKYNSKGIGIDSKNEEELLNVIYFQWNRLNFLLECIKKDEKSIKEMKDEFKNNMCEKCQNIPEYPCKEDFLTYVKYSMVRLYDP